jgi:chromosome partitioning protein
VFVTTFGQKGGVAKTCTSIHLAAHWANSGRSVVLVDSDRNRSATAYASRGSLPFDVVPMEAAAKATRNAEIVVTDGQASSNEEELKNLVEGSDFIVLPTTPQSRSIELTVEMSCMLNKFDIPYAALIVKADARKRSSTQFARSVLTGFDIQVLNSEIPLLNAFENAETEGVTVDRAVMKNGRSDRRRMSGFFAYSQACSEIESLMPKPQVIPMPVGWNLSRLEDRAA